MYYWFMMAPYYQRSPSFFCAPNLSHCLRSSSTTLLPNQLRVSSASYCVFSILYCKESCNTEKAPSHWEGLFTLRQIVHTEILIVLDISRINILIRTSAPFVCTWEWLYTHVSYWCVMNHHRTCTCTSLHNLFQFSSHIADISQGICPVEGLPTFWHRHVYFRCHRYANHGTHLSFHQFLLKHRGWDESSVVEEFYPLRIL